MVGIGSRVRCRARSTRAGPGEAAASTGRLLHWLGKFHVLLLHFPIALVLAGGAGEAWSVWRRNPHPAESVQFCLRLAALAALPTATLGWLFAAGGYGVG